MTMRGMLAAASTVDAEVFKASADALLSLVFALAFAEGVCKHQHEQVWKSISWWTDSAWDWRNLLRQAPSC